MRGNPHAIKVSAPKCTTSRVGYAYRRCSGPESGRGRRHALRYCSVPWLPIRTVAWPSLHLSLPIRLAISLSRCWTMKEQCWVSQGRRGEGGLGKYLNFRSAHLGDSWFCLLSPYIILPEITVPALRGRQDHEDVLKSVDMEDLEDDVDG
jgi:hypothetical protein